MEGNKSKVANLESQNNFILDICKERERERERDWITLITFDSFDSTVETRIGL